MWGTAGRFERRLRPFVSRVLQPKSFRVVLRKPAFPRTPWDWMVDEVDYSGLLTNRRLIRDPSIHQHGGYVTGVLERITVIQHDIRIFAFLKRTNSISDTKNSCTINGCSPQRAFEAKTVGRGNAGFEQ